MIRLIRTLLLRFSLRVQSILLMVAIGGILSAAISYSLYRMDMAKIDEEISRKSRVQADLIQKLSLDALIAADRPALQTITEGLKGLDIGLDRMVITDFEGSVLASWESEGPQGGRVYSTITPIQYRGQNFGTLELSWNHQEVAAPMKARALELAHTVILSIVVLGFCFVLFVELYFVKPLNYLKKKVEAFDSEQDHEWPDQEFVSGELRQLDQSLDEAVRVVKENTAKERELQEERAKVKVAEAAASARSEFLSLMSHEIRTPLGAILGFAQLMESTRLNREQSSYVGQIRKSGAFLLTILNDILDLSKIEANRVELANDPFDLESLLDELHSMSAPQARRKNLEFSIHLDSDPDLVLLGDVHRIKQVLMNLCGNAIKFTEIGEVVVDASARILEGTEVPKAEIRFSVSDTGIGMTDEQAEKIFEPFSQADASITRRFGGTGLGVSISKELVSVMGGKLAVDTEKGMGSTFSFVLKFPLAEAKAPAYEIGFRYHGNEDENGRKDLEGLKKHHRLLVVEDDPANQFLIRKLLGCLDQIAEFVSDGRECLDLLSERCDFDAILLDLRMPRMSGIEVLEAIRSGECGPNLAKIPVAVMSADVLSKEEALEKGADDFIMKPIEVRRLREFLEAIDDSRDPGKHVIPFPSPRMQVPSSGQKREKTPAIMVAEDNPAVRRLLKKVLKQWGFHADFADDGEQCLREVSKRQYDAIVSDLRMPNMDGLTLISKIRNGGAGEISRDIAIALMTAEVLSEKDFHDSKADLLIPKPIPMDDLRSFLDSLQESGDVSLSG